MNFSLEKQNNKDFFNEYGKNGSQFAGRSSYEPTGIYQVSALVYTQILTSDGRL